MKERQSNRATKIVSTILNIIFYVFISLILIFAISNLSVKDQTSIPGLFGNGYLTVLTDSMDGNKEDSFTVNDIILVKTINENNREKIVSELEKDDIITFLNIVPEISPNMPQLVTHRIVHIIEIGGDRIFVTQGDKVLLNESYQYDPANPSATDESLYQLVNGESISAVYTGKITGAGATMKFLTSQAGFLICIVLPCVIFCIYRLIVLIIGILKIKQQKFLEEHGTQEVDLEAERERIRAELLAEMEKKSPDNNQEK